MVDRRKEGLAGRAPERKSMEYNTMEELLPVVTELAKKYTANESSSVPYHVAQMLMEAVIYCVEEYEMSFSHGLRAETPPPVHEVYKAGYEAVLQKVYGAKTLYEELLREFQDYGCGNYKNTVLKGMPQFFVRYDPVFCPQDHLLTLDYPLLWENCSLRGVDRIEEYLRGLSLEKEFLNLFDPENLRALLKRQQGRDRVPYMGNLCELALANAIGCFIAGSPAGSLCPGMGAAGEIAEYFQGDSLEEMENKIKGILGLMLRDRVSEELLSYLRPQSRNLAVRIENGIAYGGLNQVFLF